METERERIDGLFERLHEALFRVRDEAGIEVRDTEGWEERFASIRLDLAYLQRLALGGLRSKGGEAS